MKKRHLWIIGLIVVGIAVVIAGCTRQPGDSDEISARFQNIESTLTSTRAQIAQNRAQIEALQRSVAAAGTPVGTTSETGGDGATAAASGDIAALVAAMQEDLTDLSARVAEMEIFFAEMNRRMQQMPAGMRPGG